MLRVTFMSTPILLFIAQREAWRFGVHDNTRGGWLVMLAYAIAACLCWLEIARKLRKPKLENGTLPIVFWIGLSAVLTALGINKQLDLHSWLLQFGRHIAVSEGLLEYRRLIQAGFVAAVTAAGVFALTHLFRFARRSASSERPVLAGSTAVLAFVLLRITSINHVDEAIGFKLDSHRGWIALELAATSFLSYAVWRHSRSA